MTTARIGFFTVPAKWPLKGQALEDLLLVLEGCAVLRAAYQPWAERYAYVAIHESFEEVDPHTELPTYDVVITRPYKGKAERRFVRIEKLKPVDAGAVEGESV